MSTLLCIGCVGPAVVAVVVLVVFGCRSVYQRNLHLPRPTKTHLLIQDGRHLSRIEGVIVGQLGFLWHMSGYVAIGRTRGYSHIDCMTLVNGIIRCKRQNPHLRALIFVAHAHIVDTQTMDNAIRRLVAKFPCMQTSIVDLDGICIRSIDDTRYLL
jgi:hypothetical protein